MNDYEKSVELELPDPGKRWELGMKHHPMSERIMDFLSDYDFEQNSDYFCWKRGGDGDNGEELMYELDTFFDVLDSSLTEKDKC